MQIGLTIGVSAGLLVEKPSNESFVCFARFAPSALPRRRNTMAKSLAGIDLQIAIAGHLKNSSFRLQEEEEWDHNNKIDFVVTKFPRYPKSVSLGVQVTGWCGNASKLNEFVAKNDRTSGNVTVADKAIYLEIGENVDINKGGADLVAQILYAFQFDEQFEETKVWAATIRARTDSIAYRFFDPRRAFEVEDRMIPITAVKNDPVSDIKGSVALLEKRLNGDRDLEGVINSFYTEGGFGFISGQDGSTYHLHISNIKDPRLSNDLNGLMRLPGKTRLQYYVVFEDGGKTRPDATYRTARNVKLMLKN